MENPVGDGAGLRVVVVGAGILGATIASAWRAGYRGGPASTCVRRNPPILRLDQRRGQVPGRLSRIQPSLAGDVEPLRRGA